MKCPACGAGMEVGHLFSDDEMYWLPGDADCLIWRTRERVEKKGGVLLGFLNVAAALTAWHCRKCRQLVVRYGGGESLGARSGRRGMRKTPRSA